MARKRPTVPSVQQIRQRPRVASQAQRQGASRAGSASGSAITQAHSEGDLSPQMEAAMEALSNGDDSLLLPYQPTPSINPPRPRTLAAGYDAASQTVFVRFREGAIYAYEGVPPRVWRNFKRVKSPGRAINRTLNNYSYHRIDIDG